MITGPSSGGLFLALLFFALLFFALLFLEKDNTDSSDCRYLMANSIDSILVSLNHIRRL